MTQIHRFTASFFTMENFWLSLHGLRPRRWVFAMKSRGTSPKLGVTSLEPFLGGLLGCNQTLGTLGALPGCGSLYSTCHHILCLVNRLTVNLITVIMCFEGVHQVCLVWINIESMSPCYLGCFHQFFVDHRGHTGTIWGPYLHLTLIVWAIICCLTARLRRLLCSRNVIGSCHDWFKVSPVFLLCSFSGDAPPLQGNDYSCTHMCKHCNLTLMLSTTKLIVVHML